MRAHVGIYDLERFFLVVFGPTFYHGYFSHTWSDLTWLGIGDRVKLSWLYSWLDSINLTKTESIESWAESRLDWFSLDSNHDSIGKLVTQFMIWFVRLIWLSQLSHDSSQGRVNRVSLTWLGTQYQVKSSLTMYDFSMLIKWVDLGNSILRVLWCNI